MRCDQRLRGLRTVNVLGVVVLSAVLIAAVLPVRADAGHRRTVPFGWVGVNFFPPARFPPASSPAFDLDAEAALMAASGVESVRIPVPWATLQPTPNAPDFSSFDRLVGVFASHGITVLPVVESSPSWASDFHETLALPNPQPYAQFMTALVARYGPAGKFWSGRAVPKTPIRTWQIWNEPNLRIFWTQPFAPGYVALLRAAHAAVKGADRGAEIMLSGLPNYSWIDLRAIYRAGGRGLFESVAIHPYGTQRNLLRTLNEVRAVMRRYHDTRLPMAITEFAWASGAGRALTPKHYNVPWNVTESGQARQLRAAYKKFAANRVRLRIDHVYWFSWFQPETQRRTWGGYTGLRKAGRGGVVVSKPALRAYRQTARKLEGCSKTSNARRCR